MRAKLNAVKMATAVGENVIVANGAEPGTLMKVLAGQETGTLFLPQGATVPAWKRWIGYTKPPQRKADSRRRRTHGYPTEMVARCWQLES